MSRVGYAPITIPDGLSVEVSAGTVKVSGSQGELSKEMPEGIEVQVQESVVTVSRNDDSRQQRLQGAGGEGRHAPARPAVLRRRSPSSSQLASLSLPAACPTV